MSNVLSDLRNVLSKKIVYPPEIWRVIDVSSGYSKVERNGITQVLAGVYAVGQTVFINNSVIIGVADNATNEYEV